METLLQDSTDPELDTTKLRVLLMLELHEGSQTRFLDAYEHIRHQVASVPGHLRDQLCQSIEDPTHWLITSEWSNAEQYLAWVDSPEHQVMVQPLHGCVRGTRSLRFAVARETDRHAEPAKSPRNAKTSKTPKAGKPAKAGKAGGVAKAPKAVEPAGPAQPGKSPRSPKSVKSVKAAQAAQAAQPIEAGGAQPVRLALTFTVKPGSEAEVARILSGYRSPPARVNATTSLRRTSVFLRGNRVVRAIEVVGDLRAALRHVAEQPQVKEVETRLNAFLEEPRDLDDAEAARAFFMRASLAEAFHLRSPGPDESHTRRALLYPVRPANAEAAARLLARHDEDAVAKPGHPIASTSIYLRGDILVRLLDLNAPLDDDPASALGIDPGANAARLTRLLDLGKGGDPTTEAGLRELLAICEMTPVTDRRAPADT